MIVALKFGAHFSHPLFSHADADTNPLIRQREPSPSHRASCMLPLAYCLVLAAALGRWRASVVPVVLLPCSP